MRNVTDFLAIANYDRLAIGPQHPLNIQRIIESKPS